MIDIQRAIKKNLFTLFYQPKFDISKNKIVGAEALIRLKSKDGYISPSEFILEAEKNGEIIKIDQWVFNKIIKDSREIFTKSNENIFLSFNVSAKHFENENFIKDLEKIFTYTKDFWGLFEIEITESGFLKDIKAAKEKLKHLKKTGFKIAIDDFGVGCGFLTYLKDLPIDTLKIDKFFIDNIETDEKTLAIVESLIYLSKKLNLKTVAEGVENASQVDILKNLGCNVIQGYYYSKPLPLEKFVSLIKKINNPEEPQFIKWSNKYSTGSYAIDSQHMIIINMLNKLFEVLKDKNRRKSFPLEYFTEILDDFINNHFKMEENIMRKYKYPFFQKHKTNHEKFIKEYNKFKQDLTNINERNLYNLFNMLKEWFNKHELKEDKEMVEYLKYKKTQL